MIRSCLFALALIAACASKDANSAYYVPYDGYGEGMETVTASYAVRRANGDTGIDVSSIATALNEFLSPAGDRLILLPNRLDKSKLDYSLASLSEMDKWLRDIHTINELQADEGKAGESLMSDGRGDNSVLFAGLYLGEVIQANSGLDWQWQRFDRFIVNNPDFAEHYGYEPGFDSFVLVGPQGVATPINTALKRILFGKEESLQFIGELLVEPIDLDAATSGYDFYGLDQIR